MWMDWPVKIQMTTRMWANAQRDGRPAEHRWRPVQRRKVWLTPTTWLPCSNAAKTWYPLKYDRVPQTRQSIWAVTGPSSPCCEDIWRRYCCLTSVFPTVDTCLSCEDIARQSRAMVLRWRFFASFLRPVFPASRLQQISDLHSKFALRPHNVSKYGRHSICGRWD